MNPATVTKQDIMGILETVCDPEIPVLTIFDMGIVRDVLVTGDAVEVIITPTYTGCPAMDMIAMNIRLALLEQGIQNTKVTSVLSPPWTTAWMTEAGREKLLQYGIAPPKTRNGANGLPAEAIACPQCGSAHTRLLSQFGSTACKALYQCNDCKEPFDYFKCH